MDIPDYKWTKYKSKLFALFLNNEPTVVVKGKQETTMPFGPTEGLQRDWKVKQDLAGKGNNCYHFYADANPPHVHTKTTNNSVDLSDLMSGQAKKEAKFQGHKSLP